MKKNRKIDCWRFLKEPILNQLTLFPCLPEYPLFKEHSLEIQQFCGGPMSV